MDLTHKNFWELSPYCYCQNRDWLTIDDISSVVIPLAGEDQDEIVAISGLSRDDTALLAGFLSALALLLFLIFLLLCCLFPWGLCCADGKCGSCCGGGDGKKKKEAMISSSDSSTGSVNLTALDMRIPRPWTDVLDGYSDSDFEKTRKLYAETDVDKTDRGFTNEAYQKDSSFIQDGGWFSTSDLESVYGSMRGGSRRRKERRRRSFDETGSISGSYHRSQNMSRSVDNLDTLMTYTGSQIHGHEADAAVAYSRSQTTSAVTGGGGVSLVMGTATGDDVTSFSRFHGDASDGGSIVEELKLTRTLNLPGTMQSSTGHHENLGAFPSVTSPAPYKESTNQIVPSMSADSRYNTDVTTSVSSPERPTENDVISEYRAYRRVMKETTTTTTTTTED